MTHTKANKSKMLAFILGLTMCLALMLGIVFASPTNTVYAEGGTPITELTVSGLTEADVPQIGKTATLPNLTVNEGLTLSYGYGVYWFPLNTRKSMTDTDTFESGFTYALRVQYSVLDGYAILKLALCKIYRRDKKRGMQFSENLSDWKKKYESDEVLVRVVAKHYNLLGFLRYDEKGNGKPEEQKPQDYEHKGHNEGRHKYIATAMEACIAAVYIESNENGENEVLKIVKKWIRWIDKAANSPN